jgi:flagellar FliL protein
MSAGNSKGGNPKGATAEPAAPVKRGGKGKLIMIAVLSLVLVGGGAGAWFYMKGGKPAEAEVKKKLAPVFVPLDNFTVNLSDREHYLQVGLTFEVGDSKVADAVKQHMPILRSRILLLLASKDANELGSADGKTKLIGELLAQAKEAIPESNAQAGIETVHFSAFVIQ